MFSPSHCEREGVADWGFGVLHDKPQSVVCPLWADCRLRCLLSLAKFGDLTFPSLPNVIIPHFVNVLFDIICKGKDVL